MTTNSSKCIQQLDVKVSVIIPCYNCENTIEETLKGLERQSYKDFEVICINDGSTDQTLKILVSYRNEKKMKLSVVNIENSGVSVARNQGIQKAKGKYIVFCDSDDVYHWDYIKLLVEAIEISGADTAYCKLSRKRKVVFANQDKTTPFILQNQTEAMRCLLYKMAEIGFYCYIYKKQILDEKKILFDIDTKYYEDREFNWRYLCQCNKIAFVDAYLYWYRVTPESATRGKMTWRKTDSLAAIKRTEKYMETNYCFFADEYKSYMYARAIWTTAKAFALDRNKDLYKRFQEEFEVKKYMIRTVRDNNIIVAVSSVFYLIHPSFFYITGGIMKLLSFERRIHNWRK